MPKLLLLLADGFEEIEALTVVDVLRRAGIGVDMAGLTGNIVTGMNGVRIHVDTRFIDLETDKYDGLILPGGSAGVDTIMAHSTAMGVIDRFAKGGKFIGAICAAPKILVKLGALKDKRATIYPGYEKLLDRPRSDKVVVDGNIITSQGPGTAMEFALRIVEQFAGKAAAAKVKQNVVA
ncbi:MAG: DJ-1/PfpI family protein [Candidatus Aenigmatarchaeota archaeon]